MDLGFITESERSASPSPETLGATAVSFRPVEIDKKRFKSLSLGEFWNQG